MPLNVQYGCGFSCPENWINYDTSPTLRIQKNPVLGILLKPMLPVIFPDKVKYGDITRPNGLPGIQYGTCDAMYCSHVLEHLSLEDLKIALKETYAYLKPGGIFRCVLPDLSIIVDEYNQYRQAQDPRAAMYFMKSTLLGEESRPKGIIQRVRYVMGNSKHLWMWDYNSLAAELQAVGFVNIRPCTFNDSQVAAFQTVESEDRFYNALAIECFKA